MDAKQLRLKVLDLAIHGKLVPQDASEEPASVLLAQIKAEKEALVKAGKLKKKDLESTPVASEDIPFEIPSSWEWVQVKEIGEVVTGSTPSKSHKEYYGGNFPFYKPADLDAGLVSLASEYLSDEGKRVSRIIPPFSTAICCIGSIGKVGYIMKEGTTNQQINSVIPCKHVEPKFVYYCCQSSHFVSSLKDRSTTVTISMVNKSNTEVIYIPLPPLAEQKRIVAEVNKWMALIDRMEADMSTLETTAVQLRARLLSLAIQGKLGTQDPNDQPAAELLATIAKEKEALVAAGKLKKKDLEVTPVAPEDIPFEIPSSWQWVHFEDIAESELGKTLDKEKNTGEYRPYLCALNILWDKIDFSTLKEMRMEDDELERYEVCKGDLLICEGGDCGRSAIWDKDNIIYYQNALHRVRLYSSIPARFLLYYLQFSKNSGYIELLSKGVTIKHFTKTSLSQMLVPLPPIEEQNRIVEKLNALLPKLDVV